MTFGNEVKMMLKLKCLIVHVMFIQNDKFWNTNTKNKLLASRRAYYTGFTTAQTITILYLSPLKVRLKLYVTA